MKARKVKGLDPDGTLADNAERIVRVRLDELCGFMPAAADPEEVVALHDMRIAAKRLRYLLELSEPLFGAPAKTNAKVVKGLQDLLGEIHDCDEAIPRVLAHVERLRAEDVDALAAAAKDRGVTFVKGTDFLLEGGLNTLRLAYSGVRPDQIAEGIGRLAEAYRSLSVAAA